jgi:adenylate kinase family enzyme
VRVAIIGSSGSGKSTLARLVGAELGAPVVELDAINWQAGWRDLVSDDPDEFVRRVDAAIAGEAWVTDGNYRLAMERIFRRMTDLVWLDYSRAVVMNRVIRRSVVRAASGQELWAGTGNREEWSRWLEKGHPIRWAWDTYDRRRAQYTAMFADPTLAHVRKHRLYRPADTASLVESLKQEKALLPAKGEGPGLSSAG